MQPSPPVAGPNPTLRRPSPAMIKSDDFQSAMSSPTGSTFADGDAKKRLTLMTRYLYRRVVEAGWIDERQSGRAVPGLAVKSDSSNEYILEPPTAFPELEKICSKLNIAAAYTMSCETSDVILQKLLPDQTEVTLHPHELTVPVVQSLHELATSDTSVRRRDYACFVRQENVVLVWSQSTEGLITHGSDVEDKLMATIWGVSMPSRPVTQYSHQFGQLPSPAPGTFHPAGSRMASMYSPSMRDLAKTSKHMSYASTAATEKKWDVAVEIKSVEEDAMSELDAEDQEALGPSKRPLVLTQSLMVGSALVLLIVVQSLTVRRVLYEVHALGSAGYNRLSMLAVVPLYSFLGIFFFCMLVVSVFQVFGPMNDVKTGNTKYYSATKPDRKKHPNIEWPHITIQMPVYKEGLKGVIQPTINSLLPAIAHYERLGGTASIFVCEDGLQVVSPEVAEMRRAYYRKHGIGYVARPPHGQDGFVRGGRFKKASNMNYALDFTLRVEDELLRLIKLRREELGLAHDDNAELEIEEEQRLYEQALSNMLAKDQGKTEADGNIRMGSLILLIDCDTRVPVGCLANAAMEMEESPEVAILQHASGVMQITDSWFENAIAYFTDLTYMSIKFLVGNGDIAPFVGHNAFLRWKALQSIRFTEKDGRELFWSENHVSEDFDVALRLHTAGFLIRLATYEKNEFKEGVSLTIFDELLRWEKYAYGCSELLFNPIYQWIYKGPFTRMFYRLLWGPIKTSSKFTIFGYIGTYYAMASALPTSLVNYFIMGWNESEVDQIYTQNWNIFIGVLVVFQAVAPFCYAIYRHRIGDKVFWWAYLEALQRSIFFLLLFGGISFHLSYALLAHLFCLPIEWQSTAKEIEASGFFISLENVMKAYKWVLIAMVPMAGGMVYLAQFAPSDWVINQFYVVIPVALQVGCHIGVPILSILY